MNTPSSPLNSATNPRDFWEQLIDCFRARLPHTAALDAFDQCLDDQTLLFQAALLPTIRVDTSAIDMSRIVDRVQCDLQALLKSCEIEMVIECSSNCDCYLNRARAYCAIWCLVIDAIVESPKGSVVDVNVLSTSNQLEIEISDSSNRTVIANQLTESYVFPVIEYLLPNTILTPMACPQGGVAVQLTVINGSSRMAA